MMMEDDDSNTMRQDDTSQDKDIVLLSIVRKDKLIEILLVLSLRKRLSLWRKRNWLRQG